MLVLRYCTAKGMNFHASSSFLSLPGPWHYWPFDPISLHFPPAYRTPPRYMLHACTALIHIFLMLQAGALVF